jgi:biotin transporter BioY
MNHDATARRLHLGISFGKRLGLVTFLAFLLKGLVWLGLFTAAWLAS